MQVEEASMASGTPAGPTVPAITLPPHWTGQGAPPHTMVSLSPPAQYGAFPSDEELSPPSPTTVHGLAPDRAAALFRAYDLMGRGWLSRTQMVAALSELSVVHGLGEKGLNQVLGQDPATSREARYSLHDFLSMYERIGLYQAKSARDERIRAMSAISQPPTSAVHSVALQTVFAAYCRYAAGTSRMLMAQAEQEAPGELRMNAQQLMRLCQDLDLLSSGGADSANAPLTFSTVDIVFAKCKAPGGARRLNYSQWLKALAALSDAAGRDLFLNITAHALKIQPQLADHQAAADRVAADRVAADKAAQVAVSASRQRSLPPSRERVGASLGSGLPRLKPTASGEQAMRASAAGALQMLSPSARASAAGPANPSSVPGRLVVLERVLMEEEAKQNVAQQPSDASLDTPAPAPARPVSRQRPATQPANARGASQQNVTEAWPAQAQSGDAGAKRRSSTAGVGASAEGIAGASVLPPTAGGGVDALPPMRSAMGSPAGSRHTSPPQQRPRSTGSPLRATRLARISMVDTAGVATEVWKFHPARPEAWDEIPPWMAPVLMRLQELEAKEEERCRTDEALHADIIIRTQKWEQAERLVVAKSSALDARLLALERRTADSDSLLGGIMRQVESIQAATDQLNALRPEVAAALQSSNDMMTDLRQQFGNQVATLDVCIAESKGGWQAALAMTQQSVNTRLEAMAIEVKAVREQSEAATAASAGADTSSILQQVDQQMTQLAEHLAMELGQATATQTAAMVEPMQLALVALQEEAVPGLKAQMEQVAVALAAEQEEVAALKAELDKAKAEIADTAAAAAAAAVAPAAPTVAAVGIDSAALDELAKTVQALHTKLEQHMDDMGEKLAEIETSHLMNPEPPATPAAEPALGKAVATLEAQLGAHTKEVSTQLAELAVKQEQLEKDVAAAAAAAAAGSAGAAAVPAVTVAPASEGVGAGVAELAGRIADLEESVGGFASAMAGISATAKEEMDAVKAQMNALQGQVETTAAAAGGTAGSVGAGGDQQQVQQQIGELTAKVKALEESMASLPAPAVPATQPDTSTSASASSQTAELMERLAALEVKLQTIPSRAPSSSGEAGANNTQLQDLTSTVEELTTNLTKLQTAVGQADAAAAAAAATATAAQAAAAEGVRAATEAAAVAAAAGQTADAAKAAAAAAGQTADAAKAAAANATAAPASAAPPAAPSGKLSSGDMDARLATLTQQLTQQIETANAATLARADQAATTALQGNIQLKQLDSAVHALDAQIKVLEGKVAAIPPPTAAGTSPEHVSQLAILQTAMQAAAAKLQQGDSKMAELEAKVQQSDSKLAGLESKLQQGDGKLAELESKVQQGDSKLAGLESKVQQVAAAATAVASNPQDGAKVAALESQVQQLEAGMQALASAALDTARRAQSAVPAPAAVDTVKPEVVMALTERMSAVEASISAIQTKQGEAVTLHHSGTGNLGSVDEGRASVEGEAIDTGGGRGGAHASKREFDTLRVKVTQIGTLVDDLKHKVANAAAGGGGGGGGGGDKGSLAPANSVAQLQVAHVQVVQQISMAQGAIAQLNNKVQGLEAKVLVGSNNNSNGAAAEIMQQQTASQMSLLQGAIVQLNGEVNSLKLAVPQLMSTIRGSSGSDASSLTAQVAGGQYGPILGAMAEEIQRNAVRASNLESDVRINMTSLAKASDVSQLELVLGARTERLEEVVEDIKNSLRTIVETNGAVDKANSLFGRGPQMSRLTSAVPPSASPGGPGAGDGTPGGANTHRYATWDALKHAEALLIKAQQQAKDEMVKLLQSFSDLSAKVNGSDDKMSQRLEVKEKVLMRMAKEVDDMKTTLTGIQEKLKGAPGVAAAAAPAPRGAPAKVKSHRYNMFDD